MPLFVHMNYPRSIQSYPKHAKLDVPRLLSEAADLMSEADIYDTYIRGQQRWDLLTKQAVTVCGVGSITRGRIGRAEFPDTLGKMSTMNKRRRLLHEFVVHTGRQTLSNHASMRLDYLVPLREHVLRPLAHRKDTQGAKESVELLQSYGFSRDDAFEHLPEFGLGTAKGGDLFSSSGTSSLDSKVKAAFTRYFNSTGKVSQGTIATAGKQADKDKMLFKQKKKRGANTAGGKSKKKSRQ